MNHFVTAAAFTYSHEITVVKHLLQEAGITHYFENEAMAGILPFYSQAFGGILLKVHPEDLDTVKKILDRLNNNDNLKIV